MRKILLGSLLMLSLTTPLFSQTQYFPPDQELWILMEKALDDLPMSNSAHQQIKQILTSVQQEARTRIEKMIQEKQKEGK